MSVDKGEHNEGKDHSGPEQCGCGPDGEKAALAEIEKAREEIKHAKSEIEHGERDLEDGLDHLTAAEKDLEKSHHERKVVHFTVDGEAEKTDHPRQTPNHIIKEYGKRDPATNYLVQIKGHGKDVSFQGKGDIEITIHECAAFQIISTGPAPVSDGRLTGVAAFIVGLKAAGYEATPVSDKENHISFEYTVSSGKYDGEKVFIGLVVPPDFPITTPGGIHVSPPIHPNKSGGDHPTGGIQDSNFDGHLGRKWQYWSRPFSKDSAGWGKTKKTVDVYLGHLWKLWDTQ